MLTHPRFIPLPVPIEYHAYMHPAIAYRRTYQSHEIIHPRTGTTQSPWPINVLRLVCSRQEDVFSRWHWRWSCQRHLKPKYKRNTTCTYGNKPVYHPAMESVKSPRPLRVHPFRLAGPKERACSIASALAEQVEVRSILVSNSKLLPVVCTIHTLYAMATTTHNPFNSQLFMAPRINYYYAYIHLQWPEPIMDNIAMTSSITRTDDGNGLELTAVDRKFGSAVRSVYCVAFSEGGATHLLVCPSSFQPPTIYPSESIHLSILVIRPPSHRPLLLFFLNSTQISF